MVHWWVIRPRRYECRFRLKADSRRTEAGASVNRQEERVYTPVYTSQPSHTHGGLHSQRPDWLASPCPYHNHRTPVLFAISLLHKPSLLSGHSLWLSPSASLTPHTLSLLSSCLQLVYPFQSISHRGSVVQSEEAWPEVVEGVSSCHIKGND